MIKLVIGFAFGVMVSAAAARCIPLVSTPVWDLQDQVQRQVVALCTDETGLPGVWVPEQ